jgi:hypothetical protein
MVACRGEYQPHTHSTYSLPPSTMIVSVIIGGQGARSVTA